MILHVTADPTEHVGQDQGEAGGGGDEDDRHPGSHEGDLSRPVFLLRVLEDEGLPRGFEGGERELHGRPEGIADLVHAHLGEAHERFQDPPVGEVQGLHQHPVGHLGQTEPERLAKGRPVKARGRTLFQFDEEEDGEERAPGHVGDERARDPETPDHQDHLEHGVRGVADQ